MRLAIALALLFGLCACRRRLGDEVLAQLTQLGVLPAMEPDEIDELVSVLCGRRLRMVVEFGSGGSTLAAAACGVAQLYSVDSSLEWLRRLNRSDVWATSPTHWHSIHADIGPLLDWGQPAQNLPAQFDLYSQVHRILPPHPADVVLVDGRFRVACAVRSTQLMSTNSLLLVHDYQREEYRVIERFYRLERRTRNLAVFRRAAHVNLTDWFAVVERYKHVTE